MRWLLVVGIVLAGCSKKQDAGPSCAEITDHVHAVFHKEHPGHANAMNRANDIQQCAQRKLSAEERRCVLAAQTLEAIGKCRETSVQEQDRAPATGTPPAPPARP
jgi:hypothetical protein